MARSFEELESALKAIGQHNPIMLAVARTNPDAIEALLPAVQHVQLTLAREAVLPAFEAVIVARNGLTDSLKNIADDIKNDREIADVQTTALDNALTDLTGKVRAFKAAVTGKKAPTATGNGASGPKRPTADIVAGLTADEAAKRDRKLAYNDISRLVLVETKSDSLAEAYGKNPAAPKSPYGLAAYLGIAVPEKHQATYQALLKENKATNADVAAGQAARKAQAS